MSPTAQCRLAGFFGGFLPWVVLNYLPLLQGTDIHKFPIGNLDMSLGYLVLPLFLGGVGVGAVWLFQEKLLRKAFYVGVGAPMLLYNAGQKFYPQGQNNPTAPITLPQAVTPESLHTDSLFVIYPRHGSIKRPNQEQYTVINVTSRELPPSGEAPFLVLVTQQPGDQPTGVQIFISLLVPQCPKRFVIEGSVESLFASSGNARSEWLGFRQPLPESMTVRIRLLGNGFVAGIGAGLGVRSVEFIPRLEVLQVFRAAR